MTGSSAALSSLYDELARWQWGKRDRVGTAMRKRLLPSESAPASADAVDDWLLGLAELPEGGRFLDVGCGFGLTAVRWASARPDVSGRGLTISSWQAERAREQVADAGLSDRVGISVDTFQSPPRGPWNTIVSIESLGHAPDLAGTLAELGRVAAPAARLLAVEDVAATSDVERCPEGARLRSAWATEHLWSEAAWRDALRKGGWRLDREFDLTSRVPATRGGRFIRTRRLGLAIARAFAAESRRVVCDAFLGGLALERLYASGRMRYRGFVCTRSDGPASSGP